MKNRLITIPMSHYVAKEKRLIDLIVDQFDSRHIVPLQLPLPFDPRAKRVAEMLIADPSDQRLLQELCEKCGASKRTIERIFQDETHMTIGKWRQQLRMLHSIQILASGEKVISVALEAGYSSPSAFVSAFRRVLGSTPSHYFEIGP
jgi:AraC-like DNA-binding protein